MNRFGVASVLTASLAVAPALARANAQVELAVEPSRAEVGEAVRVHYGIRIVNESGVRVSPLDFGQLEVLSDPSPPQLPMMFGGGGGFMMTMDSAQEYVVRAPRAGRYVISGARVLDAQTGRVVAQHPDVVLEVGGSSALIGGPGDKTDAGIEATGTGNMSAPRDPDAPPLGDLSGAAYNPNAFLRVALDPPEPWLGQQAVLRVWLYVASSQADCDVTQEPGLTGFWNESLLPLSRECATRWFTQNVGGSYMAVGLVRRIALFPSQTGTLSIGPMTAEVQALTGGGFFHSMRRLEAHGPSLAVTVREPPAQGRPEGYVPGTVGPVTLTAELDNAQVPVGETATFTLHASSEGSLSSAQIGLPTHVDGVRVRQGDVRSVHDASSGRVVTTLTTEALIVPERPGDFTLGEARLPYWDPVQQRYGVATATLPVIHATGAALPRSAPEGAMDDPATELRPMIAAPALRGHAALFGPGAAAVGAIATPPTLLALGALGSALGRAFVRRRRTQRDEARGEPEGLLLEARRALAKAGDGPSPEAISLAGRALDRALARARNDDVLDGLSSDDQAAVESARALCDAARFAGEASRPRDVVASVERAVRVLEAA